MKTNRFKTIEAFKNYASENYNDFWHCQDEDITRAWNYYNSEDARLNNFSIHYCLDVSLEVSQYNY